MFESLSLGQLTTIQALLALVGLVTIGYICFIMVSWLIIKIAILIKWTVRVVVAAALSRFLLEWAGAKLSLPESIRTLLL